MNKTSCGLVLAIAISLLLCGCEFDRTVTGPLKDENVSLDLNNAQRAHVELDIPAGELKIRGGAAKLLQGHLEYNVPEWQPEVVDKNNGQTAEVVIRQREHGHAGGNRRNRWDIEINDQVMLDLNLNCGAGRARLELGELDLNNVNVHMGAGQVELDLEGHPTRSYNVSVAGGVGQAIVRLPRDVGVRAQAHGGLGSIEVRGLTKHEGYYSNDLYGNAKVNVVLQVEGGIGQIRILG